MPKRAPKLAVKSSSLHGLGVFAREDIQINCRVGVLRGKEVSPEDLVEADDVHRYQGKHGKIYDAFKTRLNVLKNSNHSCEVSDWMFIVDHTGLILFSMQPNMGPVSQDNGDVWFFALRTISKDDELTWNYGCKRCKQADATFICKCGSACCKLFYTL